jgi:alanine racemase
MPEPFMPKSDTATVTINGRAISHNAAIAQSLAPQAKLLSVIKANAYGHGINEVSQQLTASSVGFGVARLSEAIQLRESGCSKPIVVMSQLLKSENLNDYAHYQLTPVIHTDANAKPMAQACLDNNLPYWLKMDTGMHRLGLTETNFKALGIHAEVIATHMHSADDLSDSSVDLQTSAFHRAAVNIRCAHFSLANSATLLRCENHQNYASWLQQHATGLVAKQEIIRPGIMLYGANPLNICNPTTQQLQPAMTFSAPVIDLHRVRKGETVGYGQRWRADRDSTIATVAAGYADGYPRHARNGTPVLINGKPAKLAGTVSMDMIGVDVTDTYHEGSAIKVGDTAILWGDQLRVETIASYADTISYTLLTGISDRVKRVYH